jgi:hypothetical protein
MKHLLLIFVAFLVSLTSYGQIAAISGPGTICVGSTATYTDATPGGSWSCSGATLTIAATGIATGVALGVATITYTVGASYVTYPVTVTAIPAPITGPSSVCAGSSIALSASPSGGIWSSSVVPVAVIGSTGILTGLTAGITTITYTISTGCATTRAITVNPIPAPITGPSIVCTGSTITLSDVTTGGVWTSHAPAVASVSTSGGVVTGIAPGSVIIDYVVTTGCLVSKSVTVTTAPAAVYTVTGGGTYCAGATGVHIGLSSSDVTVMYQLYNGGVPVGAPVTGTGTSLDFGLFLAAGTYTIVADPGTSCATTMSGSVTVSIAPLPVVYSITGGGSYCTGGSGSTIGLSGSSPGIMYQLYNGISPVGSPIAGTGTAISFGAVASAGTYTVIATDPVTTCTNTMSGSATITVSPLPNIYTVTGGGSYCSGGAGMAIGLSNSDLGVDYELYLASTLTGAPVAGTGTAISFGLMSAAGVYTVVATDPITGCSNNMSGSATITVVSAVTPSVTISASAGTTLCGPTIDTFSAAITSGGTTPSYSWHVNAVVVGTSATYAYTPVSGDIVGVFITSSAPCASPTTASATVTVTVDTAFITASSATACGGVVTLTAGGSVSYAWSPSGLSCSTCGSATITPSVSNTYTVTGTDAAGCIGTATVAVDGNSISGTIIYTGGSSTDIFQVWLIQFNPSDSSIVATDSMTTCMTGGTTPNYQFMDPAAGNYLVKAELVGSVPGTSGYIPTYAASTPNWYSAAGITHSTSADVMNITMVYGTVPPGPGFISGYVYAGAGKGTTGDAPEPGMTIYLKNAVTGTVLTHVQTDATGLYSFGSLGYGTYIIYPESYKYYTTPSDVITISATSTSVNAVNFRKSTTFGTIKPKSTRTVTPKMEQYYIVPNPTSGEVMITWPSVTSGNAVVTVTDLTGRTVYSNEFNATTGKADVELNLENGIYFVAVKTINYNYSTRLMIQK